MQTRYLITDYDDCAFLSTSERPDKLSQTIIDMARNGNYSGFYACTHRCYCNLTYCLLEDCYNAGTDFFYNAVSIIRNYPTYQVTEQFSEATELPVIAVSMLDDLVFDECGKSYKTVIEPYERLGKIPELRSQYLPVITALNLAATKNHQLTQIARHAAAKHPGETVVLDYVDNSEDMCNKARTAMEEPEWPENVYLNVFHYRENQVENIYEADIFYDAIENDGTLSPLLENSIFKNNLSQPANMDIKHGQKISHNGL